MNLRARHLRSIRFVSEYDLKEKEVLDIGCGSGWCEQNFLNRGVGKIVGSEISEKALESVKKIRDKRLTWVLAGATSLPFDNTSFDTVVCWEVIEHIPKDSEDLMFSEVRRVLKPGGAFYLSTPYRSLIWTLLDPAWWFKGHRHYSKEQLTGYAERNGFKIEVLELRGGFWEIAGILSMYFLAIPLKIEPFYMKYVLDKADKEYEKDGFVEIFVKYRKEKDV